MGKTQLRGIVSMLTRLIQGTDRATDTAIEYEYEYRDAEYEYESDAGPNVKLMKPVALANIGTNYEFNLTFGPVRSWALN